MMDKNIIESLIKYNEEYNIAEDKNNLSLKILPYSSDKSKNVTVEINGNRSSLISLAEIILEVAFADFENYHSDMGSWMFIDYDAELCITLVNSEP